MKKAMSPTIWLVIAIVVALVVALILILVFKNSSDKAGGGASDTMDGSKAGIDASTCRNLCNTCKVIYGAECNTATRWQSTLATSPYFKCSQPIPPNAAILTSCV